MVQSTLQLAHILAHKMERLDIFELTDLLEKKKIPVHNEAKIYLLFWRLPAAQRNCRNTAFFAAWVKENNFLKERNSARRSSRKKLSFSAPVNLPDWDSINFSF